MSHSQNKQNNINSNERREVGEYKVPDEVYNANWRDDIEDQAKEDDKIRQTFEFYEDESAYDSRKSRKIDEARLQRFRMAHRQSRLIREAVKLVLETA